MGSALMVAWGGPQSPWSSDKRPICIPAKETLRGFRLAEPSNARNSNISFRFHDLPRELREMIYVFLFDRSRVKVRLDMNGTGSTLQLKQLTQQPILNVCRQIRHEAIITLLKTVTLETALRLTVPSKAYDLPLLIDRLGPVGLRFIQRVDVTYSLETLHRLEQNQYDDVPLVRGGELQRLHGLQAIHFRLVLTWLSSSPSIADIERRRDLENIVSIATNVSKVSYSFHILLQSDNNSPEERRMLIIEIRRRLETLRPDFVFKDRHNPPECLANFE